MAFSCLRPRSAYGRAAEAPFLEGEQAAQSFQRLEISAPEERRVDALEPRDQIGRTIGAKRRFDQRTGERRGARGGRGVHQHDLDGEIDLADQRRRCLGLHHMVLEQKSHFVQEFDRGLPVDADDRAVDEEPFAGSERDVHAAMTLTSARCGSAR
jgi:hypothetical protein